MIDKVRKLLGLSSRKTGKKLILSVEKLESRVAVLENGRLEEYSVERKSSRNIVGSVYKGKVKNIEMGLKAMFVDIGFEKNAFLHFWDAIPAALDSGVEEIDRLNIFHASMLGAVQSESQQAYRHYLATWRQTIGKQIWSGVCATCHGNLGQGGYGPPIANNSVLVQKSSLESILRNGVTGSQGSMPPVGDTWTEAEINHLVLYMKRHIYKAQPVGATSGG